MISAIVFDIGGVLLRTEDYSGRRALEEKYALEPGEVDRLVFNSQLADSSTIGKINEDVVWNAIAEKLALSSQALYDFKAAFWSGDRLDQGLIQFLQDCREDYITALLSNAWKNARETLASKYGIVEGKTVDHILLSSELGVAKPDPKIFQILAATLACEFHQILFVDDFAENIAAAQNLGIQVILYEPGMALLPVLEEVLHVD